MVASSDQTVERARFLRPFFQDVSYIACLTSLSHALAWFATLPVIGFSPAWSLMLVLNFVLLCACGWLGRRAGLDQHGSVSSEGMAQLIATIAQVGTQSALVGLLIMLGHETDDQLSSVLGQLIHQLTQSDALAAVIYLRVLILWCAVSVGAAWILREQRIDVLPRWIRVSVPILLLTGANLLLLPWFKGELPSNLVILLVLLTIGLAGLLAHARILTLRPERAWQMLAQRDTRGPVLLGGIGFGVAVGLGALYAIIVLLQSLAVQGALLGLTATIVLSLMVTSSAIAVLAVLWAAVEKLVCWLKSAPGWFDAARPRWSDGVTKTVGWLLLIAAIAGAITLLIWRWPDMSNLPSQPPPSLPQTTSAQIEFVEVPVSCLSTVWVFNDVDRVEGSVSDCTVPLEGQILVVVGSATREGQRSKEEDRALRRAKALAAAISSRRGDRDAPAIYLLNLGQEAAQNARSPRSGPELKVLMGKITSQDADLTEVGWRDALVRDVRRLYPGHSTCRLELMGSNKPELLECS